MIALFVALAIPFTSWGAWFGFVDLPAGVGFAIVLIVALYLVAAEIMKKFATRERDSAASS